MRLLAAFRGVLAGLTVLATSASHAQPVETRLLPSDGRADQQFGVSIGLGVELTFLLPLLIWLRGRRGSASSLGSTADAFYGALHTRGTTR
jgi:hypothetical protein